MIFIYGKWPLEIKSTSGSKDLLSEKLKNSILDEDDRIIDVDFESLHLGDYPDIGPTNQEPKNRQQAFKDSCIRLRPRMECTLDRTPSEEKCRGSSGRG